MGFSGGVLYSYVTYAESQKKKAAAAAAAAAASATAPKPIDDASSKGDAEAGEIDGLLKKDGGGAGAGAVAAESESFGLDHDRGLVRQRGAPASSAQ